MFSLYYSWPSHAKLKMPLSPKSNRYLLSSRINCLSYSVQPQFLLFRALGVEKSTEMNDLWTLILKCILKGLSNTPMCFLLQMHKRKYFKTSSNLKNLQNNEERYKILATNKFSKTCILIPKIFGFEFFILFLNLAVYGANFLTILNFSYRFSS